METKREINAVIGTLFGDEGKGNTVQWLCKEAISRGKNPIVVRFSGGSQAGHTVSDGKLKHVCSSYGSGTLLGVPTLVYDSALFDPIAALNEHFVLKEQYKEAYGYDDVPLPKILITNRTRIITPYDIKHDIGDSQLKSDGTCASGQWSAINRYKNGETVNYNFYFIFNPERYIEKVREYYGYEKDEEIEKSFVNAFNYGHFSMVDSYLNIKNLLKSYDSVILEGSQGLLLDAEKGFYPHVTSTNVGVSATFDFIRHMLGADPSECNYHFVARTYLTRHGNGYEPKPLSRLKLDLTNETNQYNEHQGVFKTGKMEKALISQAFNRHLLDNLQKKYNLNYNLVITHMDVCREQECFETTLCDFAVSSENFEKQIAEWFVKATGVDISTVWASYSDKSEFEKIK